MSIDHRYRLRADWIVDFNLPADLTAWEAARLSEFIKTLPFDAPTTQPINFGDLSILQGRAISLLAKARPLSESLCCRGSRTACALRLEHCFNASVHVFLFDKLAALGRRYSFFHGGKEAGFLVQITGNDSRYQPLRGGPGFGGHPCKPRLLLGGEMHFHS